MSEKDKLKRECIIEYEKKKRKKKCLKKTNKKESNTFKNT